MNDAVRSAVEVALRYAEGAAASARGRQARLRAEADGLEEVALIHEAEVRDLRAALEEKK